MEKSGEDVVVGNDNVEAPRKRTRNEEEDDGESPPKKLKLELLINDLLGLSYTPGNDATPKKSPADSAYFSYPSVGASSGVSTCSLFSPNGKGATGGMTENPFLSFSDLIYRFRRNYIKLKDELEPKHCLADKLYAADVLTMKDMEKIKEEPTRSRRADMFIKSLVHSSKATKDGISRKIMYTFKEEKLDYLLSTGEENPDTHNAVKTLDFSPDTESFLVSELQFLAKGLEENVEPRDIIDTLLVCGFLSFLDHEDIYSTPHRHERVKILVDHVKRGGKKNFHHFEKALKASYPELPTDFEDKKLDHILPPKEIAVELSARPDANETTATKNHLISAEMMELKINWIGQESVSDIEMAAVNENTVILNLALEEEAMDIGNASPIQFSYSSIRILFKALSEETVSRFIDALGEPQAIQRIVNQLFTQEQLNMLHRRNVHTIRIQLNIPETSLITRQCICKVSKKAIVKHFTHLERELKHPEKYLETFSKSQILDLSTRQEFCQLKNDEGSTNFKVDAFLRKLLTLSDEAICLFEKHLKENGQADLVKTLTEKYSGNQAEYSVGPKEIRRNHTYLMNEIEPKLFISCFENTVTKQEDMISSDSRRIRCKRFLESIVKAGQSTIDKFCKELKKQDMTYVLELLCKKGNACQGVAVEDIRKNVLKHYATVVDEIEPIRLRQKFVQERVFKAPEFDEMLKVSTQRRGRVVWLLRKLLHKDPSCLLVFVDALKTANYLEITSMILDKSEDTTECPFLRSKLEEAMNKDLKAKQLMYNFEFTVTWTKETPTETDLQLSLHRSIYQTETLDKTEYTETWVQNLQQQKDKDDPYCATENKENKRPESETAKNESDPMKLSIEMINEDKNIEFCERQHEEQALINQPYPTQREPVSSFQSQHSRKGQDVQTARATDNDTASIPSNCSTGRQSPYQNTFEDITPCQSPSAPSHVDTHSNASLNIHYKCHFPLFNPVSPCGSGGTACNSDTMSPTQSPTTFPRPSIRSQRKDVNY